MRSDWSGRQFIRYALIVLGLSVIFFYSGKPLGTLLSRAHDSLGQWVVSTVGFHIKEVDFHLVDEAGRSLAFVPLDLKNRVEEARQEVLELKGVSYFAASLDQMKERLLKKGWIEKVALSRNLNGELKVQVHPKRPRLVLRSPNGWALFDAEGFPLVYSNSLPGTWIDLPRVYGMEAFFQAAVTQDDLRREFHPHRDLLAETYQMVKALQEKVRLPVEVIKIKEDIWNGSSVIELVWFADGFSRSVFLREGDWQHRLTSLQYVLSDVKSQTGQWRVLGQFSKRWIFQPYEEPTDG